MMASYLVGGAHYPASPYLFISSKQVFSHTHTHTHVSTCTHTYIDTQAHAHTRFSLFVDAYAMKSLCTGCGLWLGKVIVHVFNHLYNMTAVNQMFIKP